MREGNHPTVEIVEQAANWAALLDDAEVDQREVLACEAWCAQDRRHRLALERLRGLDARLGALDAAQKRVVAAPLRAGSSGRGHIVGGLAAALLLGAAGWFAGADHSIRALWPDHATAMGEQRTLRLPDGSELVADTDTRFDSYGTSGARTLALFQGQLMATVARQDATGSFAIVTREGRASALGTRYAVLKTPDATQVTVIESHVRLCPRNGTCADLSAGQRAVMTADAVGRIETIDPESAALWASGWIEVHDRPLPEVLADLARYAPAGLQFDARELSRIRVTGSYPLTRPDAALQSIADTSGLELTRRADGALTIRPRR